MSVGYTISYGEAGLFDKSYRGLPAKLKQPDAADIVLAFIGNCDRTFELSATPINLVVYSMWLAVSDRAVRTDLAIPLDHADPSEFEGYADAMLAKDRELRQHQLENENYWNQHWEVGAVQLSRFFDRGTMNPTGAFVLMSSMAIFGWMSFESLAVDLWKLAVNTFPQPLAQNILKGDRPLGSDLNSQQMKNLNLSVLEQFGFDLSKSMGDVLVSQRRVFLDSFKGIFSAYNSAFKSDFDPSILNATSLKRLEALRNLYAHRGGVVDKTFMRRIEGLDTVRPLEVGQPFNMHGVHVQQMMNDMISSASALILFVDGWIDERRREIESQPDLPLE
jgi:hypothetical protein